MSDVLICTLYRSNTKRMEDEDEEEERREKEQSLAQLFKEIRYCRYIRHFHRGTTRAEDGY